MSGNFLKIRDLVTFSLADSNLIKIKDDYEGNITHQSGLGTIGQPQGLQIRIAATHAGIITRNNGFYLPDKMKKGASSFTDNYPAPVLVHHQDEADNIGRVHAAQYIDTSGVVQDQYKLVEGLSVKDRHGKEVGIITDVLLKDFVSDKMPFGMQVDTVCSLLRDSLLRDSDYAGLGHIQIVASITDKAAIEKLLDGRYLTGSVGAITNRAVCSVCKQDWTESGRCDHKPGGIYDGAKAFIIAGNLNYEEYSFVNVPADRHSKVLELNYNGIQDSVEIADDYSGRIYEVKLSFPQYDSVSKEEEGMAKKKDATVKTPEDQVGDKGAEVAINDSTTPEPQPAETKPKETEAEGTGETKVTDAASAAEGTPEPTPDTSGDTTVQDDVTPEGSTEEESLDDFLTRVIDAKELSDEDEEKLYDMMWEEVKVAIEAGECECDCDNLEDAKLSTGKRKKLASSTFCGPGRSFPVPDCAHVTAARRLIGRYKGPGNKSSILSCVARKAKALGCSGGKKKKDSVQAVETTETTEVEDGMSHGRIMHMVIQTLEEAQYFSKEPVLDEAETKVLQGILSRLAKLVGKDALQDAITAEGIALTADAEQALVDEVTRNEDSIGELRDELEALRKEYSLLHRDMEVLQDSLVKATVDTRQAKEAHLTTLVTLRDAKVEERDFTELEDSAVDSELDTVLKNVDMNTITGKLGDGMARVPTEDVDDPSGIQDNNQKRWSVGEFEKIEEQYQGLLFSGPGGPERAAAFIKRMKQEGKLPSEE